MSADAKQRQAKRCVRGIEREADPMTLCLSGEAPDGTREEMGKLLCGTAAGRGAAHGRSRLPLALERACRARCACLL